MAVNTTCVLLKKEEEEDAKLNRSACIDGAIPLQPTEEGS
jgi:hypothetical protein